MSNYFLGKGFNNLTKLNAISLVFIFIYLVFKSLNLVIYYKIGKFPYSHKLEF